MLFLTLAVFLTSFTALAFKDLRRAIQFFLVSLPSYLLRFKIGPLPTTLLEIMFGIIFFFWLIQFFKVPQKERLIEIFRNKYFAISLLVFLISSIVSIFISDMWWFSFGQWRAYFLEPIIFLIILLTLKSKISNHDIAKALSFSAIPVAAYAIFQKISGLGLPDDGRVVSFFTSPNSVGLFLGPLIFISAYIFFSRTEIERKFDLSVNLKQPEMWSMVLSLIAILFTKSFGTVIGLTAGLFIALIVLKRKKVALGLIIAFIFAIFITTVTLPLSTQKSQSLQNRLTLWSYSFEFLTASPKNYFFGTGIRQFFRKVQKPHYDVKELERLIYPHNIFLNFWTEIGFFGMLGFTGFFSFLISTAKQKTKIRPYFSAACLAILASIFAHGLIDVPYFKNDLSFLFFALAAFILKNDK